MGPVRAFVAASFVASFMAFALASPLGAAGEKVRIHGGFVTGNQFRDMTGLQKKMYVAGLLDGMLLAPAFGGTEARMQWLHACTERFGVITMRAVIIEYFRNPAIDVDRKSAVHMYRAIRGACRVLEEKRG